MVAGLVAIGVLALICFCGVLLFGAPYLPTLKPQAEAAVKLAGLKPGQTLLELGCGDGHVVLVAARQGLHVVAYEINPFLVLITWLRTRRYRGQVQIIWGNFWRSPWPKADAIFVFLLPKYMSKLHKKCIQYNHKPVKLVSFAFQVEELKPTKQENGVFLYTYLR